MPRNPPADPDSLASRLRAVRTERGLSQQALADLAGVHQATLAGIERGRRVDPAASVLLALAAALDVDPRDLLPVQRVAKKK